MAATFSNDISILLVDDSQLSLELNRKILNKLGYDNVFLAENGIRALKIVGEKKIDLILSDQRMPDMNGLEFLKSLRQDPKTSDIPFLLISALQYEKKTFEKYLDKNFFFLKKPYRPDELNEALLEFYRKINTPVPEQVS